MNSTYLNPVYPHGFPDPYVLKHCGEYWAYCTGFWHDGRCFGVLHSRDLVHWRPLAGALEPLPGGATEYWAPEVIYDNGRFYMYYSVGNEERMQMRVAVAEHPAGPFVDSGRGLTSEPFAIDGHVFVDDDGARYLFYATDFLEHSHIGTGTVRDRFIDHFTLAGRPISVTLPRYDWHVYDPQRIEKGGVRWHTVEGPFVLKRKGRYYQMFSGGNWRNISYGVSYAVSDSVAAPGEWSQVADGERVLPILRTVPGKVIGPGHNSVVRGPDNMQLFCVYHLWTEAGSGRLMGIDPLDWAGERMLVLGPSTEPRPAPLLPTFADFFDQDRADGLGPGWECVGGQWLARGGAAVQQSDEPVAEARHRAGVACFVCEVSLRALGDPAGEAGFGVSLHGEAGPVLRCLIVPARRGVLLSWRGDAGWAEQQLALPPEFVPHADHLLRLEVDGALVGVALDDAVVRWHGRLDGRPAAVALCTQGMSAAFSGFALTLGWTDLFTGPDPALDGWLAEGSTWEIADRELVHTAAQPHATIVKGPPLEAYALTVNARLVGAAGPGGCYGFYPAMRAEDRGPLLTVEQVESGWSLVCRGPAAAQRFDLPAEFDPAIHQQFRFRKQGGRLAIEWQAHELGLIDAPVEATWVGLYAHQAAVAFDMVRVTAIVLGQ